MIDLIGVYARLASHAYRSWDAIPLRLIVGFGFMEHGYAKNRTRTGELRIDPTSAGVPAPDLLAWVTIVIESFGGLAAIPGAFIPIVSIPMAIIPLAAIFTVHVSNGLSSIKLLSVDATRSHFGQPGHETPLVYLAALMAAAEHGAFGEFCPPSVAPALLPVA